MKTPILFSVFAFSALTSFAKGTGKQEQIASNFEQEYRVNSMEAIRNMGDVIFDNPELGSQRHPGKFQPGFPEALRPYDTNKDGKLTTNEIKPVIDRYLSSQTEFSSREMVRFIDYFFSQF
ncbi:MAG: hypothetical protein U0X34_07990 [Bacteroidia bacterium]|jgi:hypothetical protein